MTLTTLEPTLTTRLTVDVVSGDLHPVSWLRVDASYEYPGGTIKRHRAVTDGDGRAVLVDQHPAPPVRAVLTVAGEAIDLAGLSPDTAVVVEL